MSWKPAPAAGVDVRGLTLSPAQGYLLSRVDGLTDTHGLALVTGLPEERVQSMLRELVSLGAVAAEAAAHEPAPAAQEPAPPAEEAPPAQTEETGSPPAQAEETETPFVEAHDEVAVTHRALWASSLEHLTPEERIAMARTAVDPTLSALCFDPLTRVAVAVLENLNTGLQQARLLARHHHTAAGIDALTLRAGFGADSAVRRALLLNPQLPAGVYRRLWASHRLLEQFHVASSREVTEQTRRTAREVMRTRFSTAQADERVELIMKTEGRCLAMLSGLPIDSRTTSMLCGRTFASTLLIQNIARWSAAPPQLIAHLLRADLVKRQAQLRLMLERHPNAPKGG